MVATIRNGYRTIRTQRDLKRMVKLTGSSSSRRATHSANMRTVRSEELNTFVVVFSNDEAAVGCDDNTSRIIELTSGSTIAAERPQINTLLSLTAES